MSRPERFHLYTIEELEAMPPTQDLVEGLIPEDALGALYGPSMVGKTFGALWLALCVSEGIPFLGKRTRPGPVIIVVMEGFSRYRTRIRAGCQALDLKAPSQLYVVRDPLYPHDAESVTDYIAAVRTQRAGEPVALTILDTLSRASAGSDENSNAHRALTTDGLRSIQAATGGAVVVVAHTGWNQTRLRGGYSLFADCDVILNLTQEDTGLTLEAEKVRDGEAGAKWPVCLTPQGDSMVFGPAEAADTVSHRLTPKATEALEALAGVALSDGVSASVWERASGLPPATFYRLRKQLLSSGHVSALQRGKYTVSAEGQAVLSLSNHSHGTLMGVGPSTISHYQSPCKGDSESGVPESSRLTVVGAGGGP